MPTAPLNWRYRSIWGQIEDGKIGIFQTGARSVRVNWNGKEMEWHGLGDLLWRGPSPLRSLVRTLGVSSARIDSDGFSTEGILRDLFSLFSRRNPNALSPRQRRLIASGRHSLVFPPKRSIT